MTSTNKFRDAHAEYTRRMDRKSDHYETIRQALTLCANAADHLPELQAQVDAGEKATEGEWRLRADEFDDWGEIKSMKSGGIVATGRAGKEYNAPRHRLEGTDPFEDNSNFITTAANNRAIHKVLVEGLK